MRRLLLFLAVIACAGTGRSESAGVRNGTPASPPTGVAWKAYDNPGIGLSFAFPADWGVVTYPMSQRGLVDVNILADSARIYMTRGRTAPDANRLRSDSSALGRAVVIAGDTCTAVTEVNPYNPECRTITIKPKGLDITIAPVSIPPGSPTPDSSRIARLLASIVIGAFPAGSSPTPACPAIADLRHSWFPGTSTDSIPRFSDYPAVPERSRKSVKLDLGSNRLARVYTTRFRGGLASGPNFAGHYRVVEWGCGTQCMEFGIVDTRTGRVLDIHENAAFASYDGYFPEWTHYCLESRLLEIVRIDPAGGSGRSVAEFYELAGDSLRLVFKMDNRNRPY